MVAWILLFLFWFVPLVAVIVWFRPEQLWPVFEGQAESGETPETWAYAIVVFLCAIVPVLNMGCALAATSPRREVKS